MHKKLAACIDEVLLNSMHGVYYLRTQNQWTTTEGGITSYMAQKFDEEKP